MRLLLADDHALVRAGFRALLAQLGFIAEVFEAGDDREAIAVAHAQRPDAVLIDIAMPAMNGFEAMSRILKEIPGTRVIMVSMYEDEEMVWRALRLGAAGYVAKSAAPNELEAALHAVDRGEVYISPSLRTAANDEQARNRDAERDPQQRLTPRQREILQLIAEGMTSREIGETLKIHIKTVESHRMHLMKRLGIHDVAGLVRYAIRHKVVLSE